MWGLIFLAGGLAAIRKELATVLAPDGWLELGPVFVAAPLAVFAAEHFVAGGCLGPCRQPKPESAGRRAEWDEPDKPFLDGIAAMFFGTEQMLHPEFTPGVPDVKLTRAWVPLHAFLGIPGGALLLVTGAALLINIRARTAVCVIGVFMICWRRACSCRCWPSLAMLRR